MAFPKFTKEGMKRIAQETVSSEELITQISEILHMVSPYELQEIADIVGISVEPVGDNSFIITE